MQVVSVGESLGKDVDFWMQLIYSVLFLKIFKVHVLLHKY